MTMKKIIYTLLGVLGGAFLSACSDNDDSGSMPSYNLDKQQLTITRGEVTSTTFTFDITAKDSEIPYVCLYADKATIDAVPKGELPEYMMAELKAQAKEAGMKAEDYISSIAIRGNLENHKIEGLHPGKIYELVAFAVSGTKVAYNAEYMFFETRIIDQIDCTFSVEGQTMSNQALLKVTPSVDNEYYYFNVLKKSIVDTYIGSGQYDVEDLLDNLYINDFQSALARFAPTGQITDASLQQILDYLFKKGTASFGLSGLVPETEYVWIASAFRVSEIDDQIIIGSASPVSNGTFKTQKKEGIDLKFDISAVAVGNGEVKVTVSPSDNNQTYLWFTEIITDANATLTAQELALNYMENHQSQLDGLTVSGRQEKTLSNLPADSRYCVLAWGMSDGKVTTLPVMYEFGIGSNGAVSRASAPAPIREINVDSRIWSVFPIKK